MCVRVGLIKIKLISQSLN